MSLIKDGQFWYIGSPYSKYPTGLEAAFEMACQATAYLGEAGVPVYSPISRHVSVSPTDHDFWVKFDAPLVRAAAGLIVVMAEGWNQSRGLTHEIEEFQRVGKPVVYWDPSTDANLAELIPSSINR